MCVKESVCGVELHTTQDFPRSLSCNSLEIATEARGKRLVFSNLILRKNMIGKRATVRKQLMKRI